MTIGVCASAAIGVNIKPATTAARIDLRINSSPPIGAAARCSLLRPRLAASSSGSKRLPEQLDLSRTCLMEHAQRPSYRQIPTGTSASAASGCRTGFGIAASAPASDYHEETPEREERLARRVSRVSLRHTLTIGSFEGGLFRLIQHVKIARQPGPPLVHSFTGFSPSSTWRYSVAQMSTASDRGARRS